MLRRSLLQLLGSSLVAAPFVGFPQLALAGSDPLAASARRFNQARRSHSFLAAWEGVTPPGTAKVSATVSGHWPEALRGTLYRNGPGLFERGGQRYQHWFDGDGLIQAWKIGADGVTHQSRFVNTAKFARESRSGKFEVMAAGTTIPNARPVSGPDAVNTANISVLHIGGKTYALWEAGSAYEIDPDTLETRGPKVWRVDLEGVAFSAHPVYEPDGGIWNFGLFGRKLVVYQVAADGQLRQAQLLELPREGYIHSFTASASKLVFVLAPLVKVRDAGSYFEGLGWREELGSFMVVLDKSDLSKPRFAEFESGAAYHYADAWDEPDGTLALRACWYSAGSGFSSPFKEFVQGHTKLEKPLISELVEVRLAATAKRAELRKVGFTNTEFPMPTSLAQKAPVIYLQGRTEHPLGGSSCVLSLDEHGKALGHFDFGDDCLLEEQLFLRADGKRYTLGTMFDAKRARTGLVLLNLDRLGDGPVAQAWLDRAMPMGFHGTFVGA